MTDFSALLGPAERFRPAAPASLQEVEAWVGAELPSDKHCVVHNQASGGRTTGSANCP
ncbi:hypothetical protein ACWECC_14350 [Streptomyces microflavus]|uniref:hypothetical protein n=1 Tax=Streptomyces microflavus TaxID=1919 RepID=UPI0033A90F80